MNYRIIRALAEKDIEDALHNPINIYGALIVSFIFAILIPLIITNAPTFDPNFTGQEAFDEIESLIPTPLQSLIDTLTPEALFIVIILGYLIAPLFLVIPLMISCIIASEAFVGEKERKTLEPLLYTPATDTELFLGKITAAMIPGIVFTWLNFLIFALIVNIAGLPIMGSFWFPTMNWIVMMIFLVPVISLLGVSVTIIISTRVKTFMEAYQATGILVLLVVGLMIAQSIGLLFLSPEVTVFVSLVVLVVDALLIKIGIKIFSRSEQITRV